VHVFTPGSFCLAAHRSSQIDAGGVRAVRTRLTEGKARGLDTEPCEREALRSAVPGLVWSASLLLAVVRRQQYLHSVLRTQTLPPHVR
jgi:hypothetical protein